MRRCSPRAVLAFVLAFASVGLTVAGPALWSVAHAEPAISSAAEKDAFQSAKELGTLAAWKAFLASYPTGFHADLARAYVEKINGGSASATTPAMPAAGALTVPGEAYPIAAASWGGIVRDGPTQQSRNVGSLAEGTAVELTSKAETLDNGFPWFAISYGADRRQGYMWGGILCSTGLERPDLYKVCAVRNATKATPAVQPRAEPVSSPQPAPIARRTGCAAGYVAVDGRCVLKRNAASSCGPGYRLTGTKCVVGYKPPKPQKQLPTWQVEAIKKGCPKGMGWNKQEGCHEND